MEHLQAANLCFLVWMCSVTVNSAEAREREETAWIPNTFEPELYRGVHPKYILDVSTLKMWLRDHQHNKPHLRPGVHPYHGSNLSPDHVDVELYFAAVANVDSIDMAFISTVFLVQVWSDRRVNISWLGRKEQQLAFHHSQKAWFWRPDTYFITELEANTHGSTADNVMLRVFNNGSVFLSRKVTMKLSCEMILAKFPFDEQDCFLRLSSFSYPLDHLQYHWHRHLEHPVRYNKNIDLPEYEIKSVSYSECNYTRFNLQYSCLDVTMHIRRSFSCYIIQVYIPSGMVALVTCLSYWIEPGAVPPRVTLGLVSVVAVVTQRSSLMSTTPHVPYVRAIDVWMAMCLFMTIVAVVEYAFVNTLHRRKERRLLYAMIVTKLEEDESSAQVSEQETFSHQTSDTSIATPNVNKNRNQNLWQRCGALYRQDEAKFVDLVSRGLFPVVFLVFNIIYWIYYQVVFTQSQPAH